MIALKHETDVFKARIAEYSTTAQWDKRFVDCAVTSVQDASDIKGFIHEVHFLTVDNTPSIT